MRNEFNAIQPQEAKAQIAAQMIGLQQQIESLAPNPDAPKGMSFKADARAISGDDNDAILGSLVAEVFFGAALGELATAMNVPEGVQQMQWNDAIEICDEFYTDRTNGNKYTMGVNGDLSGTFYRRSIAAYNDDLQDRQKLEAHYGRMSEKLDHIERNNDFPTPKFH